MCVKENIQSIISTYESSENELGEYAKGRLSAFKTARGLIDNNPIPVTVDIKCPKCKKKICEANKEAEIKAICPRCKNKFEYSSKSLNHKVNVLSTDDIMKNRSGAYEFINVKKHTKLR